MMPWLLLALALGPQDSVRVTSRLTDPEIVAGATTTLRVEVRTDGARARIDRFRTLPPGLELVGTSESDQRQFSFPGGTTRFITRDFVLRADAVGRFRVPSVDVTVNGRRYATGSALLTVLAGPGGGGPHGSGGAPLASGLPPSTGAGARANADGVVMRAHLGADTVFLGQQVTLDVDVMFSPDARLRLRRAPEYQPPSPAGFWVHDLPDPASTHPELIGEQVYEVQTFRRVFFPLTAGRFRIPPARLDYEIRRGLLYAPEASHVATDSLLLVVRPLPDAGRPADFAGAVGRYTIRSWIKPDTVPAGEAAVLEVEVKGSGNVKALPAPTLPDMPGVEVFPPTEEAKSSVSGDAVGGWKRFSWVLIPRRTGERIIPAIRYPYFDPATARYRVATAPALTLAVEPGAGAAPATGGGAALRYLHTDPRPRDPLGWVHTRWFRSTQLLPLLLLAGGLALRRRRRRNGASLGMLRRRRKAALRSFAERTQRGEAAVLSEADAFARSWLAQRLDLDTRATLTSEALAGAGVSDDTAAALRAELDRLATARYAPEPPGADAMSDMIRGLFRILERVDREAPTPAPTRRGAEAMPLLIATLVLAPGALAVAPGHARGQNAAPSAAFATAVRLFDAGRYEDAAAAFDRYVGSVPGDPAGWYDLGTAYERAGHRGFAVWAWLHAVRLAPRDRDARHNLIQAGTEPELIDRVAPPFYARAEELWLAAALAWWLAAAGVGWWLLRRSRRGAALAWAAALVTIVAVGGAWTSAHREDTLIVLESTPLRAGPNLRGEELTVLRVGAGLEPVGGQGDWIRARTLDGEEGWVESRATGRI